MLRHAGSPGHQGISSDHSRRVQLEDGRDIMRVGHGDERVDGGTLRAAQLVAHHVGGRVTVHLTRSQVVVNALFVAVLRHTKSNSNVISGWVPTCDSAHSRRPLQSPPTP